MPAQATGKHPITVFLCGDVMTGRGIDQVLPHPNDPGLFEPYVHSALRYVELAEGKNGPVEKPVDFIYVWGDAIAALDRVRPDLRIVNLETAVTSHGAPELKGINYRMHPKNVPVLTAAGIDCAVLGNNHVLDWGEAGLLETLKTLKAAGISTAGAGENNSEAAGPAKLWTSTGTRVLVFSFGVATSGIPPHWAARYDRPGVAYLEDLSGETLQWIVNLVKGEKRDGDIVIVSLHWGGNWGYEIPRRQVRFAHRLIDKADVDIVYGHSSHHVKGIEVYRNKLILYGCGDFLSDYEGIEGHEPFRDDLGLMYFATIDSADGKLVRLEMSPTRLERLRINHASDKEARWLVELLNREGQQFGTGVSGNSENVFELRWSVN